MTIRTAVVEEGKVRTTDNLAMLTVGFSCSIIIFIPYVHIHYFFFILYDVDVN